MNNKERTCCFTGQGALTEEEAKRLERRLRELINVLIRRGYTHFCAGGGIGFDMLAELAVLDMKAVYPDIRLTLVLPYPELPSGFSFPDSMNYDLILKMADRVVYTGELTSENCLHERDRRMVEMSDFCVCYLTRESSRTAYTAQYARKSRLPVLNLAEAKKIPTETVISAG